MPPAAAFALNRRRLGLTGLLVACSGAAGVLLVRVAFAKKSTSPGAAGNTEITNEICVLAPPRPYDPHSGLGLLQARPVPADARCPVCGMVPAHAPEWAAQLIFSDGATQYFDSPVSLLIYLQDVARFAPGRKATDVAVRYVRDSRDGHWLVAEQAYFVSGSNALGPMRAGNLPAFADAAAAQTFAQARGGQVLRLDEIAPELLRRLDPRSRRVHAEH
ncbi:nitrous oxide reductase accessory protein NosL [Roseateles koreensis]|uniref:Nitrous oxide reductase accessory protein NosL n=1 Tax=Roseateles koreensis TaxID=2987526 RepID=A0ABT5KX87_9BURK|nr:nitrous oxide reductase accessory protein NosL [Roseateles koreensis]MDC8786441.1 nitrous oxide reductase accessory protein NosL [Roseateles koreensis]